MISRSNIAKYWRNKGINKNSFEIEKLSNDSDFNEVEVVVSDWGEPECWACGKPMIHRDDDLNVSINQIWNVSGLERCHIYYKQFGGKDVPENLFLLCHKCHVASPDTRNPCNFFAWVVNRRTRGGYIDDIKEGVMRAAESKHINLKDILDKGLEKEIYRKGNSKKLVKDIQLNSGYHGSKIVDSTFYMNLIDEICKEQK